MSLKWNIERIELFFYNAGENRWEMFQETTHGAKEIVDGQPESFFRAQLQKLIATVRVALAKKRSRKITCLKAPKNLREEININLTKSNINLRKAFQNYCKKALKAEGIKKDWKLVSALEKLRNQVHTKIPSASIPDLLSVLPFARDWDIFGWLHPMSTGTIRCPVEFWNKLFVYRVGYCDKKPGQPNDDNQPLDYDVFFQMIGSGSGDYKEKDKSAKLDPDPQKEIPYFNFAKSPLISRKGQRKMNAKEYALYMAYAATIDAIQKSSASVEAAKTLRKKPSKKYQKEYIYYAVYPVVACGYYHFVQLKVTPNTRGRLQPDGLLHDCNKAFVPFIRPKYSEYAIFKESLRELLVQIRLSAFQHYVTAWMENKRETILKSPDTDAVAAVALQCFCELAPHLNEMRAIETKNAVWAHVGDLKERCPIRQILKPWAEATKRAVRNKNGKVVKISLRNGAPLKRDDYRIKIMSNPAIKLWLFHKMPDKRFIEECFAGTNARRLEEQFDTIKQRMQRYWHAGRAWRS